MFDADLPASVKGTSLGALLGNSGTERWRRHGHGLPTTQNDRARENVAFAREDASRDGAAYSQLLVSAL